MNLQQRAAMIRPRGKSEAPHMIAAYRAMQMALGAMLTAQNTLIFKCGGDIRPMERQTIDDLVEAITLVQIALPQPQETKCKSTQARLLATVDGMDASDAKTLERYSEALAQPTVKDSLTAQTQGEWVDLTDDEIEQLYSSNPYGAYYYNGFSREVIAKFKKKNTPPVVPQVVTESNASEVRSTDTGEPVAWMNTKYATLHLNNEEPYEEYYLGKAYEAGELLPLYTTSPSVEAAIEATKEKAAKVLDKQIVKLKQVLGYCEADEADAIKSTAWQISVLAAAIREMK